MPFEKLEQDYNQKPPEPVCLKNWVGNSLGLGNNNVEEINI